MSGNWTNWTEFVEEFCASDFWYSESYYANSSLPNVTPCFQQTVLVGVPALFVFVLAPVLTFQLDWIGKRYDLLPIPRSFLSSAKSFFTFILFTSSLIVFLRYLVSWDLTEGQVFIWSPLIRFQISAYLAHTQRRLSRLGHSSNGILFNSTLLLLMCSVPEARSWTERIIAQQLERPYDFWTCVLFWFWFLALISYVVSQFWADPLSTDETLSIQTNPSFSCSFVNRICLCWPSTMFMTKTRLQRGDLFSLNRLHDALPLFKDWNRNWMPKLKKSVKTSSTPPSIIDTLFTMFKWELISTGLLRLVADLLLFTVPFFFYLFVGYLDNEENEHLWKGIALALLIVVALQLHSFMLNYSSMVAQQVGVQVRATLSTVVYKKTLRLTSNILENQSPNKLQQLLESDVKTIQLLFANLHTFWSPIFQFGLIFILLYLFLKIASFPIMVCVLLFVASNLATLADGNPPPEHLRLLSKVLNNARTVKLRVWEEPIQKLLNAYRSREAGAKVYLNFLKRLGDASAFVAPFVLILVMTLMCLTLEKEIPNRNLFIALYLLYQLCRPMNELRLFIQIVYHLFPANQRLKDHLLNEQIDHKSGRNHEKLVERGSIRIEGGYFSSDYQIPMPTLLDVNLDVVPGSLVTIVGENALECKNLLHALAGELKHLDGQFEVDRSVGYVPANPWFLNVSIVENIQFVANKQDQQLYEQLIERCELSDVLKLEASTRKCSLNELLTQDQKVRIAVARAIYSKPDIFLFENIFKHDLFFNEIVGGLLAEKTRLIITKNLEHIRKSDLVIFVNGPSVSSGPFNQLTAADPDFDQFARYLEFHSGQSDGHLEAPPFLNSTNLNNNNQTKSTKNRVKWQDNYTRSIDEQHLDTVDETVPLISTNETNRQAFKLYWNYFRSLAPTHHLFSLSAFPFLLISLQLLQNVWLTDWIDTDWKVDELSGHFPVAARLGIFVAIGMLMIISTILILYLLTTVSSKTTTTAYLKAVERILNAPVEFFTSENINQLNCIFNKDFLALEIKLPASMSLMAFAFVYIMVMLLLATVIDPFVLIFVVAFLVVLCCLVSNYLRVTKQLSRMKHAAKHPIVVHLLETSQGATTIRSFNRSKNFAWRNDDLLDFYSRVCESKSIAEHWLQIRLLTCANWFVFLTLLSALFSRYCGFGPSNSDWIALSLALLLNLPFFLQLLIKQLSKFDQSLIPTSVLKTLSLIEQETKSDPPALNNWLNRGKIRFENFSTYKNPSTFLQNLSVEIKAAQKVVIVGEGRAGITSALFRTIETAGGQIFLDNLDIGLVDVRQLRQCLAVLPEEPFLLDNESLRFNLDPNSQFSDDQLWQVLKSAHLDEVISNKWTDALSHPIDADDDFSLHQKWLLELSRTLLHSSKLLIIEENLKPLDEATTLSMLEIVRRDFADSTILIVTSNFKSTLHRDMPVLLLRDGRLEGFDLPHKLIADLPTTSHT